MALVCRAAEKLGHSPAGTLDTVQSLLRRFSLPCACPFSAEELFRAATADKKRTGDSIDIVLLEKLGQAKTLRLTLSELREFMEAAL